MITIREVSELAGVSTSTVSRVVSKNGIVSSETRKKVLAAIKKLGYQPNSLAQGLKNKRSNVIGVVVPDISSAFFALMLRGVEQATESANMNMIVVSGHAHKSSEKKAINSLLSHRCDALILTLESILTRKELEKTVRNQVPIVILGRQDNDFPDQSIYLDNQKGGYMATQYLIEQGHKNIIHLTGPLEYADSRLRLDGYRQALSENKIKFNNNHVIEGDFTEEFGFQATIDILKRNLKFSAIFAGDDEIAAGVMEALKYKNVEVPEKISLIGFDDMSHARYMHPKLTTIKQPMIEMGHAAGKMAINLIRGRKTDKIRHRFDPELIIRSTVTRF